MGVALAPHLLLLDTEGHLLDELLVRIGAVERLHLQQQLNLLIGDLIHLRIEQYIIDVN